MIGSLCSEGNFRDPMISLCMGGGNEDTSQQPQQRHRHLVSHLLNPVLPLVPRSATLAMEEAGEKSRIHVCSVGSAVSKICSINH